MGTPHFDSPVLCEFKTILTMKIGEKLTKGQGFSENSFPLKFYFSKFLKIIVLTLPLEGFDFIEDKRVEIKGPQQCIEKIPLPEISPLPANLRRFCHFLSNRRKDGNVNIFVQRV